MTAFARWPQHHLAAALLVGLLLGTAGAPTWLVASAAALAWALQPRWPWAAAAVLVLVGGMAAGGARTAAVHRAALAPLAAGAAVGPAEPVELLRHPERALDGGWRADVRLRGAVVELRLPVAVDRPALDPGDHAAVRGRLRPAGDRAVGARSRGIGLVLDAGLVDVERAARGGWRGAIDGLRRRAEATLDRAGTPERSALLRGIVLGQDEGFSPAQEEAYRRSGLAHLVAASGQNVALLAALVLGTCALLGVPRRWRLASAALAVAAYVPLAGDGPSIRRAGVMGVLTLAALALGRPADRWWALLLAGIATVLVDPTSPLQLGWQLSFAAVVGLLLLVDPLAAALGRFRVPRWASLALAVPLSASLATAPVLAATVGDVSLTGVAANVAVEPIVAPLTWLGMVAGLLGPEGSPLSGALVAASGPGLDWIDAIARRAAAPSWAVAAPGPLASALPALAATLLLILVLRPPWLAVLRSRARRVGSRRRDRSGPGARGDDGGGPPGEAGDDPDRGAAATDGRSDRTVGRAPSGASSPGERRPGASDRGPGPPAEVSRSRGAVGGTIGLVLAAFAAAFLVAIRGTPPERRAAVPGVVVLDVGQGSATLLRDGDHAILVDAGPADGRVLDRLAEQGVRRLDALVLSHAAADHSGAAPAVVAALRPSLLLDGRDGRPDPPAAVAADLVRRQGGRVLAARAGLRLRAGAIDAAVRWPPPRRPGSPGDEDPNERAVVVRATVAGLRALVPSDLEGPPLRRAAGGPVDLLVLPHHGSADPDVPRLLAALRPRLAVASVGRSNGYGHPAPETVAAVRDAGVPLRRTDRDGTVAVPAPAR